ncbi:MAG: YcxB family protein [Vannielia sp.]|uniref:YcxB family protein n=1 Tax=Vannielia sp. TaxID=2813045 RepID=UPI003B8B043E
MTVIECRYRVSPEMLMAAIGAGRTPRGGRRRPGWFFPLCVAGGVVIGLLAVAVQEALGVQISGAVVLAFCLGFLAGLGLWQISWMRRARQIAAAHEEVAEAAGDVVSRFGPEGIESRSQVGQSFHHWGAVTGISEIAGGTALRLGAIAMPVPDSALPEGMGGAVFRAALEGWKGAA